MEKGAVEDVIGSSTARTVDRANGDAKFIDDRSFSFVCDLVDLNH